jgi:hypothetical protein
MHICVLLQHVVEWNVSVCCSCECLDRPNFEESGRCSVQVWSFHPLSLNYIDNRNSYRQSTLGIKPVIHFSLQLRFDFSFLHRKYWTRCTRVAHRNVCYCYEVFWIGSELQKISLVKAQQKFSCCYWVQADTARHEGHFHISYLRKTKKIDLFLYFHYNYFTTSSHSNKYVVILCSVILLQ